MLIPAEYFTTMAISGSHGCWRFAITKAACGLRYWSPAYEFGDDQRAFPPGRGRVTRGCRSASRGRVLQRLGDAVRAARLPVVVRLGEVGRYLAVNPTALPPGHASAGRPGLDAGHLVHRGALGLRGAQTVALAGGGAARRGRGGGPRARRPARTSRVGSETTACSQDSPFRTMRASSARPTLRS